MVSVILPVYNGEKIIADAISAVNSQNYQGDYEIIVVDDGSTDNTSKIVQSFSDVTYIRVEKNQGPAKARNIGFENSKGNIVFFTDADCRPHKEWIKRAIRHFDDPLVAVVSGSYTLGNPNSFLSQCIHKEIAYRHMYLMPLFPKSFGSYNFCVRRNIFKEVGGFDESYRCASGEDNDLSYKIIKSGYKIYFGMEVLVQHRHTEILGKYLHEQYRHGFWRAKMYVDHPLMSRGDDYTFWKDIIEPSLTLMLITFMILSVVNFGLYSIVASIILAFLILLELFYGFYIMKDFKKSLFWFFVMFLRSFYRTFGFLAGLTLSPHKLLIRKRSKKNK